MSILPKKSAHSAEADSNRLDKSAVVMYENDNAALLACILEFRKTKYLLLNMRGREVDLPASRLYSFSTYVPADLTGRQEKAKFLEELYNRAKAESEDIQIEEVWNHFSGAGREFSCLELASTYYSDLTPEKHIAFRLKLLEDKVYFKRKDSTFLPRPPETVAQLKHSEEERRQKAKLLDLADQVFFRRITNPEEEIPKELMTFVRAIEDVAADTPNLDAGKVREVRDFLTVFSEKHEVRLSGSNNERAYNFLRAIGHFSTFTNLALIRHKPPLEFSAEAENEAATIAQPSIEGRADFTAMPSFTIDDASTKDMDDAISLEYCEGGYRLGIHITDAASCIKPGTSLDTAALRRATSIYLPEKTIHMLPRELAQNKLSLVKDAVRPALSYMFEVDHNYQLKSREIKLSYIKVKNRYDYDQVNQILENIKDPVWEVLHGIVAAHEMERLENGAIKLHKKESYVTINRSNSFQLGLQEVDEDSPSRNLVSELMIIANHHAALFARENKIPFIYRTQDRPDVDLKSLFTNLPEGPVRDFTGRINLKKSFNIVTPKPHSSLGMEIYGQTTSPIRRYLDLCNQMQLVSFINTGRPYYSEGNLIKILDETQEHLHRAAQLSRESKRFWLLKYLELHCMDREIYGTVVRTDLKNPLVELDEVYIAVPVKLAGKISIGDRIKLRITNINPAFDYLKLEP